MISSNGHQANNLTLLLIIIIIICELVTSFINEDQYYRLWYYMSHHGHLFLQVPGRTEAHADA
jgi:hypothetical protein